MRCLSRTTELHILDFVERVKKADSNNLDVFCDFNQYRFYSSHIFYQQVRFYPMLDYFLTLNVSFRSYFEVFLKTISLFQKQSPLKTNRSILKTFLVTKFIALSHLIELYQSRLFSCYGSILCFQSTTIIYASKNVLFIQQQACMNTSFPVSIFVIE